MSFTVLIPARLASSRLPAKPLANIGGVPMVVRVARQALGSAASRVVVAADHDDILRACAAHGIDAVLTRSDHSTGSDRLAEACGLLGIGTDDIVVNVQGDEPLIEPALIDACAALLAQHPDCVMGTAAHAIGTLDDLDNPNVVKVVLDAAGRALYFSRAPIPWWRDARAAGLNPVPGDASVDASINAPLRHVGLYAYRGGFLRGFPHLAISPLESIEALEQLRVLWHGHRIAVHVSSAQPSPGVDTADDLARVRALVESNAAG